MINAGATRKYVWKEVRYRFFHRFVGKSLKASILWLIGLGTGNIWNGYRSQTSRITGFYVLECFCSRNKFEYTPFVPSCFNFSAMPPVQNSRYPASRFLARERHRERARSGLESKYCGAYGNVSHPGLLIFTPCQSSTMIMRQKLIPHPSFTHLFFKTRFFSAVKWSFWCFWA